jgi:tRNA threonylcarbamoyladenosine biosynthesis protein TsaB
MPEQPLLLAVDTATRYAGLALYDGESILSESYWRSYNNHSVELMPTLVRMLERQDLQPRDLSAVAVAVGPGSFTGLRIGLSVAKGLAQAQDLALFGVPTLDILAFQHQDQRRPVWAVIQAGRGRLCVARYERRRGRWRRRGEFELTTLDGLAEKLSDRCLVCGELSRREVIYLAERSGPDVGFADPSASMRRPANLAELGWQRFSRGQRDDLSTLSPVYLHTPQV